MRNFILIALLVISTSANAQTFLPGSFIDNSYRGSLVNDIHLHDSSAAGKKWFVSKYSGISTSFSFFKGGNATVVSAPMGLQLNRRLTNNVFAFAGVSIAPAYINFNGSFMNGGYNKFGQNNAKFNQASLGLYSRAELGLQYVNDERTFSISGSIGIERSSYPMPLYSSQPTRNNQNVSVKR